MIIGQWHIPGFLPQRRRIRLAALIFMAVLLISQQARTEDAASTSSRVRSAFVLNFIQFTDWPDSSFKSPDDPIVIGVIDPDPLEGTLAAAIEGKTVKARKLVIRHLAYPGSVAGCHVLYVGTPYEAKAAEMLKSIAKENTLTIGDPANFTDAGGIIRFYLEDKKYRFEINMAAAGRAHLQLSSKLLKLASIVNK
jgi:hypothetical protein